jgi:hypothetical protein
VAVGDIETALGGALLASLRHKTHRRRAVLQRDVQHFGGDGHLQV